MTGSLTIVEDDGRRVMAMYRHQDGHPGAHGRELAEFLCGMHVVDLVGPDETRRIANGMGCLAAQMVKRFKDGPGDVYIEPSDVEPGHCREEYVYFVFDCGGRPWITCNRMLMESPGGFHKLMTFYRGFPEDFLAWMEGP